MRWRQITYIDWKTILNWYLDGQKNSCKLFLRFNNVGIVGPGCRQGNQWILTHDFTHRKHMEIFRGKYYPPALTDWWMVDWISGVYGPRQTLLANSVEVIHHMGWGSSRYKVDWTYKKLLHGLLAEGSQCIKWYISKQNDVVQEPPASFSHFT